MSFMFNNSMVKSVEGKCSIKQARVPLLQDFSEPLAHVQRESTRLFLPKPL